MSFLDCLKSAQDQGEITMQEAQRLKGHYESLVAQHDVDSPVTAPFAAREALAAMLQADGLEKKRQLALTIKLSNKLWKDVTGFRTNRLTHKGVKIKHKQVADVGEAAIQVLENFGTSGFSAVRGRQHAIIGMAHGRMAALLREFRRSAVGGDKFRHGQARLANVVREAFGDGTGDDAARGLAKTWAETAEWLRRRYNAAGGHIPKLESWGLPQSHDARALRRAGKDTWKAAIREKLDLKRMRHPLTDKPLLPGELDEVLDHVYKSVTQEGWATREASRRNFGAGSLANQNAEHRFLVFKSSKDWIEYQKQFGEGDAFASMMAYINRMARDIAAMEILGPNPSATVEWLSQIIEKEGQKAAGGEVALLPHQGEKGLDYARGRIDKLNRMWASMRGELETPVNTKWANGFAAVRNVITASVLGGATLSSIGDAATQVLARNFNGIPAANTMQDIARAFTAAGRQEAIEAGLILDQAMHTFNRQARYVGTLSGPEWSQYLSDRILTWSGLTPWTQAGRHAFGLAFMREAAVRADLRFDQLPAAFKGSFERHGITAKDWEQIRSSGVHDGDGVRLLRPREIAAVDENLAERWIEMINSEMEYAVPTGSVRAKTFLVSQDQPGTFWGEITRSFAQFKSFGAVFMMLNAMRYVPMIASADEAVRARGAKYAGALLISTTVMGGLSIQLKQMSAGRDPRNMNDRRFLGAAALQGGGLGLFGDFLFSDVNRFGGGFPTTLAGPTVQHLWDIWTLTGGNMIELAQGKDTKAGRELVNVLRANTPGGSLWYLRLAYERVLLDQLQYLVDPKANRAFKQKQQWWKRETGQEFFWAPGAPTPERAPDFTAAMQ
jgi:hypothetical protein